MLHKRLFTIAYLSFLLIIGTIDIVVSKEMINNVPESAYFFVGRAKILQRLEERLFQEKTIAIAGISGIGKTELVRKFVQNKKSYFEVVWSIDCNNDLRYQLLDLAKALNRNSEVNIISENTETLQKSIINFLNNNGKFLLIFDNFNIKEQNKINSLIKESNGYHILLSRTKDQLYDVLELSALSDKESDEIFELIYPEIHSKLKEETITKFKGYPLGLVKSLFFLKQYKYLNLNEYIKIMNSSNNYIKFIMQEIFNRSNELEKKLFLILSFIDNHYIGLGFLKSIGIKGEKLLLLDNQMLLSRITDNEMNQNREEIYEMHDLIKETLHSIINKKEIECVLVELIDKITKTFPYSYGKLSELQEKIPNLLNHLKTIDKHAIEYKVPISKRIGVQSLRLIIYMINKDYEKVEYLHKWFQANFPINNMHIQSLDHHQLKALAFALGAQGEYLDFYFNNYKEALRYFFKMEQIVSYRDVLQRNFELNFELHGHIAQTFLYIGNIKKAKEYMDKVNIYELKDKSEVDLGFYWFFQAKVAEQNRFFKKAREYIDKSIEVANITNKFNFFMAPIYLLKADICLSEGKTEEAYKLAKKVYELSKNLKDDNEFKAETLVKLARSELALNKPNYKGNAEQAFKILSSIESNIYKDINELIDDNLAEAYVLLGDIAQKEGNSRVSIQNYVNGLTILKNRYGENLQNYNISEVLEKIISLFIKDKKIGEAWFFLDEYEKIFGNNNAEYIKFYKSLK